MKTIGIHRLSEENESFDYKGELQAFALMSEKNGSFHFEGETKYLLRCQVKILCFDFKERLRVLVQGKALDVHLCGRGLVARSMWERLWMFARCGVGLECL